MDVMSPIGPDVEMLVIRPSCDGGPAAGLEDPVAIVAVTEAEDPPFAVAALSGHLTGQGAVEHVQIKLAPAVHLKHAACRPPPKYGEIQFPVVEAVLGAIEAASDVPSITSMRPILRDCPSRPPMPLKRRKACLGNTMPALVFRLLATK